MRNISRIRNVSYGEQHEFDRRVEMGLPPQGYGGDADSDD